MNTSTISKCVIMGPNFSPAQASYPIFWRDSVVRGLFCWVEPTSIGYFWSKVLRFGTTSPRVGEICTHPPSLLCWLSNYQYLHIISGKGEYRWLDSWRLISSYCNPSWLEVNFNSFTPQFSRISTSLWCKLPLSPPQTSYKRDGSTGPCIETQEEVEKHK
jgi:hypothetical protein